MENVSKKLCKGKNQRRRRRLSGGKFENHTNLVRQGGGQNGTSDRAEGKGTM